MIAMNVTKRLVPVLLIAALGASCSGAGSDDSTSSEPGSAPSTTMLTAPGAKTVTENVALFEPGAEAGTLTLGPLEPVPLRLSVPDDDADGLISEEELEDGAIVIHLQDGQYRALPGDRGVAVVAGHRTTGDATFADLDQVAVGDTVEYVNDAGETLTFEVRELAVVAADDPEAYAEVHDSAVAYGSDTRLNIYTCTQPPSDGRWRTDVAGETLNASATSVDYRLVVFTTLVT